MTFDRPAAIRHALCDLVAERGFHGTSMNAVAREAGVAVGTAYVHYESKDELVYAAYLEVKRDLGRAVVEAIEPDAPPEGRFRQMWRAVYEHLRAEPARARFLTQLEESPYSDEALQRLQDQGDPVMEQAARPDLAARLVSLPLEVLYSLSLGHAVRLAASGEDLPDEQIEAIVTASWRAITLP